MATTRWETLAETLRQQIRTGQIKPGEYLPSYRKLAERHGVSVGTVRMAIWELRRDGLVEGEQGVGVRVLGRPT